VLNTEHVIFISQLLRV